MPPCGLTPPKPAAFAENWWRQVTQQERVIPERRDTFLALVPNRYKTEEVPPAKP
jgi:hypothetical protein